MPSVIFLNAALDQEEAHLGTLKKSLQFEIRIDGANGLYTGGQRKRGSTGRRGAVSHARLRRA
jgi:hypothetical protein